jgi:hypothetical protein
MNRSSLLFPTLALIIGLLSGCATSPGTSTSPSPLVADLSSATVQSTVEFGLETTGDYVLSTASATDRVAVAKQLVLVGNAINALASGGAPSPATLTSTINSLTPKATSQQELLFTAFATASETMWANYYPKLQANGDAALALTWLRLISQAAITVGTVNENP